MNIPVPFRKRGTRNQVRDKWLDERRQEARIVVADFVHHSDHLLRLACNVLIQHGETPQERKDARILLVVLEAKHPGRGGNHRSDPEGRR